VIQVSPAPVSGNVTYQLSLGAPRVENVTNLITVHVQTLVHQLPRLAEARHDAVFDSVVNHLDEMAASPSANIGHAWTAMVILGRDLGQQRQKLLHSPLVAPWHERRPVSRAKAASRNAQSDVRDPQGTKHVLSSLGDLVVFVGGVDHDIALCDVTLELFDDGVAWAAVGQAEDEDLWRAQALAESVVVVTDVDSGR
jgi:hypothetical protein